MTRIDFHFNAEHRLHYACRVTRKARAAGKRLVLYAGDADRLAQLDDLGLMMIGQPLAWDDLVRHAELQRKLRTPLCLDESITSLDRAQIGDQGSGIRDRGSGIGDSGARIQESGFRSQES